ncbi:gliding motility-associated C-terminal domain-containing protein, partial [Vicingaceae bacterium]|nr:gliding motility-associated C-terminal domain-containing protein [Vicingaceae bacterium]
TTYNNAVFAGATTYTWTPLNGTVGNTIISDGDAINIQVTQGTCPTVNIDVNFTVHTLPTVVSVIDSLCDDGTGQATFDLTGLNSTVNNGASSTSVIWYTDNSLGTQIVLDNAYLTGTTLVYAEVSNDTTSCVDTVSVSLIVNPLPIANNTTINSCDIGGSQGVFDLTSVDGIVNTGIGDTVIWYTNTGLSVLASPVDSFVSVGVTVYAQVIDTITGCSDTASVTLVVDPLPVVSSTSINECDNGSGQVSFDLTGVDATVNGGIPANVVAWFEDSLGVTSIVSSGAFVTGNDTVYAVVTDGVTNCLNTTPVFLIIDSLPQALDQNFSLCEDVLGSGQTSGVNLTVYDTLIKGANLNTVTWYDDNMVLVGSPTSIMISDQDSLYVIVDNGICVDTAKVTFTVTGTITLVNPNDSLCEDVFGGLTVANVDLTSYEATVFGGGTSPVFTWYQDAGFSVLIGDPSDTTITNGMIVYVSVVDGNCNNSTAVTFTVNSQSVGTLDSTICNGASFVYNGTTYDATNLTGTETFVGVNGCDSVVTVTVTESPLITGVLDSTICNGDSFVYNGTTYDATNLTGTETFVAANGCDSVVTVTVTESALITGVLDSTICNGASFVYNGTTYDATNLTGTETFVAANGCDSVVAVTVTESPLITGVLDSTICSGESFVYNGTTYDASNLTGTETFVASSGCDSLVTVTVTIDPQLSITAMNDTTICSGSQLSLSAVASGSGIVTWYSDVSGVVSVGSGNPLLLGSPGNGTHTYYVNETGGACPSNMDSVLITVGGVVANVSATPISGAIPLDVSVDASGSTGGVVSYEWDFGNGNIGSGISLNNIYTSIGSYVIELIVEDGTCSDTAYVTIDAFGESSIIIPNVFTPNGDGENDVFTVEGTNLESVEGELFNRWGQKMFSWTNINGYWDGRTLAGEEAPDGTYFYMI